MKAADNAQQMQSEIGRQVRALRLARNLPQSELAHQAGVALGALKSLETGRGATLRTLARVVQVLGRSEWLQSLHPDNGAQASARLRAGKPRIPATPGTASLESNKPNP